ncbi:hypothetical protein ACLMJK_007099 [Lecanora helva]
MTAELDWAIFSAFDNTLNAQFLKDTSTPSVPVKQQKEVFTKWLKSINEDARLTSIFGARKDDARDILDAFFPEGKDPICVRDLQEGHDPTRIADPCNVKSGTAQRNLQIMDGAAALAYLFSIAKPPLNPTWRNYFLPLLVILSKCLYIAFIDQGGGDANLPESITSVPFMSCVTYIEGWPSNRFTFGSCFTTGPQSNAQNALTSHERRQLLDVWRRRLLNSALIANSKITGPSKPLGPLCPRFVKSLTEKFYVTLFTNKKGPAIDSKDAKSSFDFIAKMLLGLLIANKIVQPGVAEIMPLEDFWRIEPFKANLVNALVPLIEHVFDTAYDLSGAIVAGLCRDVLKVYVTPYALPIRVGGQWPSLKPYPEPTELKNSKDATVTVLWTKSMPSVITTLKTLREAFLMGKDPPQCPIYGRCAETYCFACMLPNFYDDPAPDGSMPQVRGMAMDIRKIGQSEQFATGFTSLGVGKSGEAKGVYRLPCENCNGMQPVFKLKPGPDGYDADIMAVPDKEGKVPF